MQRRAFLRAFAGGLLVAPIAAQAQQAGRLYRIGWLNLGSAWDLGPFRDKLGELGWAEGKNFVIEARWADNHQDLLPILAAELVERKVDVIVTQTTSAALAAQRATTTIPIVMAGSSIPVTVGLVRSLARPGNNVTGLTNKPGSGFATKMVQLLKEAAPGLSRVAILRRAVEQDGEEIRASARELGVVAIDVEANTPDEVQAALGTALREHANGLLVLPNTVNLAVRQRIVIFTLTNKWPAIGGEKTFVAAGGLMSYWANWGEIRREAAVYVDKILRGANPADMPIEQPTKLELVINLKTAAALGLSISPSLRLRADELIQ